MSEIAEKTRAKSITYLDGPRLHRALVAGIQEVISRQDYLNRINVFPVPDRDTGTNMALTLNTIIEETSNNVSTSASTLLESVADAALNGARGNSGAILAQFFQGLSDGTQNIDRMEPRDFANAVTCGVELSYKALSEPKEGTILTVLTGFLDGLTAALARGAEDFANLLEPAITTADKALAATAMTLKEMRKAKVVDAGAQGFMDMLHGILDFIKNGTVRGFYDNLRTPSIDEVDEHIHEFTDLTHRFCTECLIKGSHIKHDELRAELNNHGNSLIVAGSERKTKVHIHANDPSLIFHICRQYGQTSGEKADDMVRQQQFINKEHAKVAIMTDSGADIPSELIDNLDIHIAPLMITFGTQSYLDKISMSSDQFYKELASNPEHPTTSQPRFSDFHRQYQFINSHYKSIISIHIPRAMSGTINNSEQAAKRIYNSPVSIIDSLSASTGLGLVVIYAAECAKKGMTHNQILKAVEAIIPQTIFFAAFPNMECAVKGGRVSAGKKRLADTLRLIPVLQVTDTGKVTSAGIVPGRKQFTKKYAKFLLKKIDPTKSYRASIAHGDAETDAAELKALLQTSHPHIKECFVMPCGAALGVHAGPGALAVAFQEI